MMLVAWLMCLKLFLSACLKLTSEPTLTWAEIQTRRQLFAPAAKAEPPRSRIESVDASGNPGALPNQSQVALSSVSGSFL
jgi:hypothetical protein